MKEAWFSFPSEADGLEISVLLVEPEGEARGTILMAHGFSEYKERYLPMMRRWADKGFACIINDHRGYGRSVRAEEDLGYTYELGAEGTLTDAAASMVDEAAFERVETLEITFRYTAPKGE